MNNVFDKTRELAEALMNSEEYIAMKQAEEAAMANSAAAALMASYLEKKNNLQTLLGSGSPDPEEVAQKGAELEEIQSAFQAIPEIEAMQSARNGFDNLISQVNQVLQFIITGKMDDPEGCTGSCATCPGCH